MNDQITPLNTPRNEAYSPKMSDTTHDTISTPDVIRIREPDKLTPLHVVMIFLATAVLAGGCLVLSAAESHTLVDGARAWGEDSPLRAVVELLCLSYGAPTFNPGDVKNYILGIGAGLALISVTIAVLSRVGDGGEVGVGDPIKTPRRIHMTSLGVAQLLVVMFLLWSFASSRWSRAPSISIGATTLLSIQLLWSFVLAAGLNHAAARIVSRILVAVLAVTGVVAIWYYYLRNPVLSAKFPFGNPLFLATCLLAGMIPAAVFAGESLRGVLRHKTTKAAMALIASVVALGVCFWAFRLTQSRGPAVGVVFGILAVVFFSLRGWRKLIPVLLGVAVSIAGWTYLTQQADAFSPTGRSATVRFRLYSWRYAWEMFTQRPIQGHGQVGFVLSGDTHVGNDVLADPLPFVARIAHAHSEWLETLCDLGIVGFVLIAGGLVLTFHAGVKRIQSSTDDRTVVALIAVISALVAICIEECFGVGLRVSGVPTVFFTLVGLTWALSATPDRSWVAFCAKTSRRRMIFGVAGGLLGLVTMAFAQQDFGAATSSFRAGQFLAQGNTQEATEAAAVGVLRLNPVRALSNRARLAETHVLLAETYMARAVDRDKRSAEVSPVDEQLASLASEDYRLADEHSKQASLQLKELVSRAPEFLGTGRLEFRINLIHAQKEASRGDVSKSNAFLKTAAAAIERDMSRRPFEELLVADYLRVALAWTSPTEALEKLARPLRHHRLGDSYVSVLRHLLRLDDIDSAIAEVTRNATAALSESNGDAPERPWAPEELRLVAAMHFQLNETSQAIGVLRPATKAYEKLAPSAPMGASSFFAELADTIFYGDMLHPDDAIKAARRAVELAPQSEEGRALALAVERRLIQYLLAGDRELEAVELLRAHAPADATNADVMAEHGRRLGMLLDAMRLSYRAALRANDTSNDPVATFRRLLRRGLELNPADAALLFLSSEASVLDKNGKAAAASLEKSLREGLSPKEGMGFLDAAIQAIPDSTELKDLRERLGRSMRSGAEEGAPVAQPKAVPIAPDEAVPQPTDAP